MKYLGDVQMPPCKGWIEMPPLKSVIDQPPFVGDTPMPFGQMGGGPLRGWIDQTGIGNIPHY